MTEVAEAIDARIAPGLDVIEVLPAGRLSIDMEVEADVECTGADDRLDQRERADGDNGIDAGVMGQQFPIDVADDPDHECVRNRSTQPADDRLARDDVADVLDQQDAAEGTPGMLSLQSADLPDHALRLTAGGAGGGMAAKATHRSPREFVKVHPHRPAGGAFERARRLNGTRMRVTIPQSSRHRAPVRPRCPETRAVCDTVRSALSLLP